MNIRPRAGETEQPDNCQSSPTQARFATPKSCHGDARARVRCRRPSHNRRTLELCPYAAAGRRFSVPAVPCRWTATPRPVLPPTHGPGAPGSDSRGKKHRGPITRAFLDVLEALLWGFHNSRSGACFPSYERIAEKAECARSTVAEALKVLEWAGVLTWQNRIARIQVRERDLFGQWASRWRVIRASNAYVFSDPLPQPAGGFSCKSENPAELRTKNLIWLETSARARPKQPSRACLAAARCRGRRKIALERERRAGWCPMTAASPAERRCSSWFYRFGISFSPGGTGGAQGGAQGDLSGIRNA